MSRVVLSTVNTEGNVTDSNAIVWNYFRIVKNIIFNSKTGIQTADFIRTIYTNMDDRIAAFKFTLTQLAHKLYKHKQRIRVNEAECKGELSRSKKFKFCYTKQTIGNVRKGFASFKSSMKLENSTSKCPMNVEYLSMKCQLKLIMWMILLYKFGYVEVISDLDLVEVVK